VVQTVELRSDLGQVNLTTKLEATSDKVNVDETHLINVFFNLIDNAIKYCKKGHCNISIASAQERDSIKVIVSDNGEGISKDVLHRIFDKFYRAHSGNLHDVKGFGLGLTYAKSIIESHRGNIWATSEPGVGTQLHIQLPLVK
jgi:two-component system, OmpR family, phosphate regulon sensor histidine kinase PhoR